jgi:CDP-3, 6-dideoxy-D-glycero-L-glycero-4-hexulose-4-reductase
MITSNITFGTKLLEIASRTGVKTFINTSSAMQNYDNNSYSPTNLYAATKQAFEDI